MCDHISHRVPRPSSRKMLKFSVALQSTSSPPKSIDYSCFKWGFPSMTQFQCVHAHACLFQCLCDSWFMDKTPLMISMDGFVFHCICIAAKYAWLCLNVCVRAWLPSAPCPWPLTDAGPSPHASNVYLRHAGGWKKWWMDRKVHFQQGFFLASLRFISAFYSVLSKVTRCVI